MNDNKATETARKIDDLARKIALAKDLSRDNWWDRNDQRHVINAYIDSQLLQMGEIIWGSLSSEEQETSE
jgi:hypothetical protein